MHRDGLEGGLFLRSKIQKEEDPTGFLSRLLDYRATETRKQLIDILGSTSGRLAWSFPSRLDTAKALLPNLLPDIDTLVVGHTRYPLFAPFLDKSSRKRLYMHHRMEGYASAAHAYGTYDRARFGICLKCVRQDLDAPKLGFSYWKRAHLIPGATHCAGHKEPLYTFCLACEFGHRRNNEPLYPGKRCLCGKALRRIVSPKNQKTEDALLAIDTMAVELMQGRSPIIVEPGLATAHGKGFMLRQGRPSLVHLRKESTALLDEAIGREGIELLGISKNTIERFLGRPAETEYLTSPYKNIAFIYAIFGSWDGLKREVDLRNRDIGAYEQACLYIPKRIRHTTCIRKDEYINRYSELPKKDLDKLRKAARAFIRAALEANPELGRGDLKTMPGGKRHYFVALYADTVWFERTLHSNARTRREHRERLRDSAQADAGPSILEIQLEKHVYRQCEVLLEIVPPVKMTRARLLNNSNNESIPGWVEQFPLVEQALKTCVESAEEYQLRRAAYVCKQVSEISKVHPYGFQSAYQNLPLKELKGLIWRAMEWLRKNSE
jgi:hypothetical protein